jgi:hypothetical protein
MYGYYTDDALVLSDAQALPNATSADSTNIVKLNPNTNGRIEIAIYANTDITVATGEAFSIELEAGATSTAASATSPIDDGHVYLVHKTSADDAMTFSEGDLITRYIVPESVEDYVQLVYATDGDLSTMKVDAFARVLM